MAAGSGAGVPIKVGQQKGVQSGQVIGDNAANELVFAVVGHVGSGTSEIARMLQDVLKAPGLPGGPYDVEILPARDEIARWAESHGHALPEDDGTLTYPTALQDAGDEMRLQAGEAAVAAALVGAIRRTRAAKQGIELGDQAVIPDGAPRAYILDSIRHPAEVHVLRTLYQNAFVLVGVVCDEEKRERRLAAKYKNAGTENARAFMARDADADENHGQHVADTFHLSDFFIDNTADRYLPTGAPNPQWEISDHLSRLVEIITHAAVVRPTLDETAINAAYGAKVKSACMSRQVGAALVDADGNIVATGTNEVPKPGGGVYGEDFVAPGPADDHRCVYRQLPQGEAAPFCSNTREQNRIVDAIIAAVPELAASGDRARIRGQLRKSPIGALLEFSRAVHAEVDAIVSAGLSGRLRVGSRLFVTTFPCHYCARTIVTAGVEQVTYIEPYPKSKALALHSDSITIDRQEWVPFAQVDGNRGDKQKVLFRPFTGVAPRLYVRAFVKDRGLKDESTGTLKIGSPTAGSPWYLSRASYAQLEVDLAKAVPTKDPGASASTADMGA